MGDDERKVVSIWSLQPDDITPGVAMPIIGQDGKPTGETVTFGEPQLAPESTSPYQIDVPPEIAATAKRMCDAQAPWESVIRSLPLGKWPASDAGDIVYRYDPVKQLDDSSRFRAGCGVLVIPIEDDDPELGIAAKFAASPDTLWQIPDGHDFHTCYVDPRQVGAVHWTPEEGDPA